MKKLILFCLFILCAAAVHAQGSVRGKVADTSTGQSMPFVNVAVYDRATQKFIKGAISDEKGLFHITGLPYGDYTVKLSYIGYTTLSDEFTVTEQRRHANFKLMHLSEDSQTLQEVTVTAQRPAMRLEVDRKSFDVTQDISNAGGAASDVLENIPSVEVDTDGNISLRGNTSVEVWINGKSSGLTSDNRAEILQQLPAESIDRIEVIDNPSAKYSAEGSAGIINIVLKKNRTAGYYGSLQGGGSTRGCSRRTARRATTARCRAEAPPAAARTPAATSTSTTAAGRDTSTSATATAPTTAARRATRSTSTPTSTSATAPRTTAWATTSSAAPA